MQETTAAHQFFTVNGILITGETDPWAKDHRAHKEDIAQELRQGGHGSHCSSVQVKGQRNGLHGHNHLRA